MPPGSPAQRKDMVAMARRRALPGSGVRARVRRRGSTPELLVRRALWATGARYRIDFPVEGIRADIVFAGAKVAVFIDGCFWHGCPEHAVLPRSNKAYWI